MDRHCRSIHRHPNRPAPRRAALALEERIQREQPLCTVWGCGRPALTVDAYFPYLDDDNRCGEHTVGHLRILESIPSERLPYG